MLLSSKSIALIKRENARKTQPAEIQRVAFLRIFGRFPTFRIILLKKGAGFGRTFVSLWQLRIESGE